MLAGAFFERLAYVNGHAPTEEIGGDLNSQPAPELAAKQVVDHLIASEVQLVSFNPKSIDNLLKTTLTEERL